MPANALYRLLLLSVIWGMSFPLSRIAAPQFGPFALVAVRTLFGGLFLVALLLATRNTDGLRQSWQRILISGILSVALPFSLLSYASQFLPAGMLAVINALTPMFGGLAAWLWLGERLPPSRILGLTIGFAGVIVLVSDKLSLSDDGQLLPILAALGMPLCYGIGACYATRYLRGVAPIASAAGNMMAASLVMLPLAMATWPTHAITPSAWVAGLLLALASTGIAYVIYFSLLDSIGPTRTVTVTFLAPPVGILGGTLLLNEPLTWRIATGAVIVLAGTVLATGAYRLERHPRNQ